MDEKTSELILALQAQYTWRDLSPRVQDALTALGYSKETW